MEAYPHFVHACACIHCVPSVTCTGHLPTSKFSFNFDALTQAWSPNQTNGQQPGICEVHPRQTQQVHVEAYCDTMPVCACKGEIATILNPRSSHARAQAVGAKPPRPEAHCAWRACAHIQRVVGKVYVYMLRAMHNAAYEKKCGHTVLGVRNLSMLVC